MILAAQPEPGRWQALALTALMHLLLVVVLFFGVQWRRTAPTVVEAELWASRPVQEQTAPPPPVAEIKPTPPVAPVTPDIAIKQPDKKPPPKSPEKVPVPPPEKQPPPKPAEKKPAPPPVQKPAPAITPMPDFKEAMAREETNRRIDAEKTQLAKAATDRAVASWSDKVRGKIRGNIVPPAGLQGNPTALFTVTQLPSGEIIDVKLKRSSNYPAWDMAVERAILKSSPLPKPDNPGAFQRELILTLCPDEERGCR